MVAILVLHAIHTQAGFTVSDIQAARHNAPRIKDNDMETILKQFKVLSMSKLKHLATKKNN